MKCSMEICSLYHDQNWKLISKRQRAIYHMYTVMNDPWEVSRASTWTHQHMENYVLIPPFKHNENSYAFWTSQICVCIFKVSVHSKGFFSTKILRIQWQPNFKFRNFYLFGNVLIDKRKRVYKLWQIANGRNINFLLWMRCLGCLATLHIHCTVLNQIEHRDLVFAPANF